jgi:hypothetical protein
VSAHLRTPPTQPTGQPQGVAPTVCREPSPVGADPCVCPSTNAIHATVRRWGNHGGCPYGLAWTITGRGGPPCPPIHKCPTRVLPTGQPQGVAPTVCREPSPVGADPCVCPSANACRRGNHRGLPLRFGMNHHPSVGADPCVCPSTNAIHAGAADGATMGNCPAGLDHRPPVGIR